MGFSEHKNFSLLFFAPMKSINITPSKVIKRKENSCHCPEQKPS